MVGLVWKPPWRGAQVALLERVLCTQPDLGSGLGLRTWAPDLARPTWRAPLGAPDFGRDLGTIVDTDPGT